MAAACGTNSAAHGTIVVSKATKQSLRPEPDPVTIEQLRTFYNAQPFKPFVMHLADGRSIPVMHREFMASAPSGRTVTVYQPDDSMNVIDLLLVTDLEIKPLKTASAQRRKG
jgi:hypothetical protein